MAEWRRDPVDIRQLGATFGGFSNAVSSLSTNLTSYSWALGDGGVQAAFNAVANNWWVERDRLVDQLQGAGSALQQVAISYENDERTIQGSLDS